MENVKKYAGAALVGLASVGSAAMAVPTAPDTSDIVTVIGFAATAGAAIGVAVLGMHYGIKLYKWIKGAG